MQNVSIVIPFFEKGDALLKTMDELTLQIHPDDETLIIDDNSPSGVPDCECPTVRVIQPKKRTPHIYRLCTLRNRGIQEAKHDCVIILDPDCIPNPHFLPNARKIFDPSVLFGGAIDKVQQDGSTELDPRRRGGSRWVDLNERDGQGGMIWGGVMVFSKARTALSGWFDNKFNGAWGAEEHDFASRCFHAGIRLRYEIGLQILHQWHPKKTEGNQRNIKLWQENVEFYKSNFNNVSPYRPAVAVMVASLLRSHYLDQSIRAIIRNNISIRILLINQGDHSQKQKRALQPWRNRWCIEVVEHQERVPPAVLRTWAMHRAKELGCKYLVIQDDDMTVFPNGIVNLIRNMEQKSQYHVMAGWYRGKGEERRTCGGYIVNETYYDLKPPQTIVPVDYVSSGFVIIRLDDIVEYDQTYVMGWNDWDWSEILKSKGKKLAVCGNAGAYHRYIFSKDGAQRRYDPREYREIRGNKERNDRMAEKFRQKWGWTPEAPLIWDGPILSEIGVRDKQ